MKDKDDKQTRPISTIEKAMQRLKSSADETKQATKPERPSSDAVVQTIPSNKITKSEATNINRHANYCELDFNELNRKGFLTPDIMNESLREEYRVIKRPLLNNMRGKSVAPIEHGNLLVVTSAMPGEGKTYNSLNLAMSFSMEHDTHVLLIDSDVIKPSLTAILGLTDVPGLTDMLSGNVEHMSDILYKTSIPKLNVIPAGRHYAHDTELLSSDKMKRLTDELAIRYSDRIVMFDAPPMLATSHARVMAQYAGQIVMIVEAGKTLDYSIKDAISHIGNDKVVGIILNKGRGAFGTSYYGSYGTYGANAQKSD